MSGKAGLFLLKSFSSTKPAAGKGGSQTTAGLWETGCGVSCVPLPGGLDGRCLGILGALTILLHAGRLFVISLSMAKLGVTKRANVWFVAGPAGVLNLITALALHVAGVPLRTWWSRLLSILPAILLLLLLDIRFGDCLYRLHHTGRIHLRRDAGPGKSTVI